MKKGKIGKKSKETMREPRGTKGLVENACAANLILMNGGAG